MDSGKGKITKGAIIVAAGNGTRMRSDIPKQFLKLGGRPLLWYSLDAFERSDVEGIVIVVPKGMAAFCREEIVERYRFSKVHRIESGGMERRDSVYAGLRAMDGIIADDGIVMIHDGARPFLSQGLISQSRDAARKFGACVAAVPAKDTIRVADADGFSAAAPDRKTLWQVQTPQSFRFSLIKDAYDRFMGRAAAGGLDCAPFTDDATVAEAMSGVRVKLIEGSYANIKVTTPEDMAMARGILMNVQ